MLQVIPRLRSPKEPFSLRYWLSKLHLWEKLAFSGNFPCLCPENSQNSDELVIFLWIFSKQTQIQNPIPNPNPKTKTQTKSTPFKGSENYQNLYITNSEYTSLFVLSLSALYDTYILSLSISLSLSLSLRALLYYMYCVCTCFSYLLLEAIIYNIIFLLMLILVERVKARGIYGAF